MARTPAAPDRARRRSLPAVVRAVSVTAAAAAAAVGPFAVPAAAAAPGALAPPAAPAASDPAGGLIEVTPRRAEPGTQIRLRVAFCEVERTAFATSVAFEADVDLERTRDGAAFHGYAMISVDAEPGTYGVTVACGEGGAQRESSLKVLPADGARHDGGGYDRRPDGGHRDDGGGYDRGPDGGHRDDGRGEPGAHPDRDRHPAPPHDHASPVAPVRAGGGGTAGDRTGDGTGTAQRFGLALAGGAVAAGAVTWAVRRRTGAHRSG